MKKNFRAITAICACQLLSSISFGQSVYEKLDYADDNAGSMDLKDVIISIDSVDIVNVGFFKDTPGATYRDHGVLINRATGGTLNWAYDYAAQDVNGKKMHMVLNSLVEVSTGGYILVGALNKASNKHVAIPGDGDVILLRVDANGQVTQAVHVDIANRMDVAYSIIPEDANNNSFIICGSTASTSNATKDGFLMKIDPNLNISWLKEIELRQSSLVGTAVDLFDVAMDGSVIWAVGSIVDTNSVNSDGLVVKFLSNGTYQTSRRANKLTDREVFYHVENDNSSNLIITGNSAKVVFHSADNRMIALKYAKSSHTIPLIRHLKTSDGAGGFLPNVGYDINLHSSDGGGYFVVGVAKSASAPSIGVYQHLNSSLIPVSQYNMSSNGDVVLRALVLSDNSGKYVVSNGLNTTGAFSRGYELKSNFSGNTGCSDSVGVNQDSLSILTDTLLATIYNTYNRDTLYIVRDSVLDSLLCVDTLNFGFTPNNPWMNEFQGQDILLFPNPARVGEIVQPRVGRDEKILEIVLFDLIGMRCPLRIEAGTEWCILTDGFDPGIYRILIKYLDRQGCEQYKAVQLSLIY